MMTVVLAVLCLYLAACYAYGGYLLVSVLRNGREAEPRPGAGEAVGPRAGILRAADCDPRAESGDATPTRIAA